MMNFTPRTLIVIQIIFGEPLRGTTVFHIGAVDQLVAGLIGRGNAAKVADRLLDEDWIALTSSPARRVDTGGRPPAYFYRRTQKGLNEYRKLKQTLAQYGIVLR